MTKPIPELTPAQQARFWARVDVRGPDECWLWRGKPDAYGYGTIRIFSMFKAHRVSMALDGRDPIDLCALHKCDNPPCCNPAHLWIGTQADNTADMIAKGRFRVAVGKYNGSHTKPELFPRGTRNGNSKLTEDDIPAIRLDNRSQSQIASEYGVHQCIISRVKRRETWRHVS